MIIQKKTANAIGGKTARACESCLKKRARWFCPADDAFLCQACDSSVHSANELAGRHKRVRLESASFKPAHDTNHTEDCTHINKSINNSPPTWHQGFTKKPRTPRGKRSKSNSQMMPLVPEISSDEGSVEEENEEQMNIFSVPTFDPFEVELNNNDFDDHNNLVDDDFNISLIGFEGEEDGPNEWDNLPGFLPTDHDDLAEFAADVETLLEQELDEDQMYTTLPLTSNRETISKKPLEKNLSIKNVESLLDEGIDEGVKVEEGYQATSVCSQGKWEVKLEEESAMDCENFDWSMDATSEILNFEVNYDHQYDQVVGLEAEGKKLEGMEIGDEEIRESNNNMPAKKRRKIFLRLNYEEIINAWAGPSPWTSGCPPEFNPDHDGWPNCMGVMAHIGAPHQSGEMMGGRGNVDGGDGDREARVSRYREKRRTRLFSKKIRYEVRKLNAEKRPRLKGRFVKRTSLAPGAGVGPTFHYMNK